MSPSQFLGVNLLVLVVQLVVGFLGSLISGGSAWSGMLAAVVVTGLLTYTYGGIKLPDADDRVMTANAGTATVAVLAAFLLNFVREEWVALVGGALAGVLASVIYAYVCRQEIKTWTHMHPVFLAVLISPFGLGLMIGWVLKQLHLMDSDHGLTPA